MGTRERSHVVNVNWNSDNSKWNVNDWNRDDNSWNEGKRVFSSENNRFLPDLFSGSFLLQSLFPTSKLSSNFLYSFGKSCVFFIIKNMKFPCDAQQEFQDIYSHDCSIEGCKFLICILVCGNRHQLNDSQKACIYLVSKCISRLLWEMVSISIPSLVYCEGMLNNRQHLISLNHKYQDIISVENLLAAWREFVAGKRSKTDVIEFQSHLMDNILQLHEDLKYKTYTHSSYVAFKISDPKPRDIHKATVRDRLLHHAIYRILYPFFDRTYISDSYSCRDNKGTHRAMDRFRSFSNKVSRNNTRTCWVLKCDIRKFFASIDQQILMEILLKYIPNPDIVGLLEKIVTSFYSTQPGKGLPLGNLTSQLLVNIYMNEFDQYAKHTLKAKYYIRYADDFVILSDNKRHLEDLIPTVKDFIKDRLQLDLHPDKVYIKTFSSGVDFLGWVHFPGHRILRGASKRRMLRNLSEDRSDARIESYKGLLSHGNAHKLSTQYLHTSQYDDMIK